MKNNSSEHKIENIKSLRVQANVLQTEQEQIIFSCLHLVLYTWKAAEKK